MKLNTTLDRHSFAPLYHQMYEALRTYIEDGGLAPGDRLPGEDELNEVFGVSQITTRKALDILVESGLIFRRRGKGTFVSDHPIRAQTEGGLDSDPEAPHDDTLLETTVFRQELVPVSNKTADLMQIQSGDELAMIERVRRADGHPFCVEKIFLVHARCPGILEHDLNREPLGALLARIHGIVLSKTQQTVRAQSAGRDVARLFRPAIATDPLREVLTPIPGYSRTVAFIGLIVPSAGSYRVAKRSKRRIANPALHRLPYPPGAVVVKDRSDQVVVRLALEHKEVFSQDRPALLERAARCRKVSWGEGLVPIAMSHLPL